MQKLEEKDLAALELGKIVPKKSTLMVRLTRILDSYPNLILIFADSGISILVSLLEAKSVDKITWDIGVKKSAVYAFLKKALKVSLVKKRRGTVCTQRKALGGCGRPAKGNKRY